MSAVRYDTSDDEDVDRITVPSRLLQSDDHSTNSTTSASGISAPFYEPLLLNVEQGAPSFRQQQRAANYPPSEVSNDEFEISYGNAQVFQVGAGAHSLNDGEVTHEHFGRSPFISPSAGLPHVDSVQLSESDSFFYVLYHQRFWVAFVFCLISFNQSLIWMTYSPITQKAEDYYGITEAQVDLLLNWGPIVNLPLLAVSMHIARTTKGLRYLVLGAAYAGLIACVLRLIPIWINNDTLKSHSIYFLNTAHILNAALGPAVQLTVTKLSNVWMGASERVIATSFFFISNNLGGAAGFILGPALVPTPDKMPIYLYVQLALAAVAFVCVSAYYPELPPTHPSKAAATMHIQSTQLAATSNGCDSMRQFGRELASTFTHRSFMLLALSSGLMQGVFNTWTGVLSTVLPSYSDSTVGWLSFSSTFAGVVAGLVIGPIARKHPLNRKLKQILIGLTGGGLVFIIWFLVSTPSIFDDKAILPGSNVYTLGIAITLLGVLVGATCPLAFEFGVELTYPLPEGVSGGAISGINNAGSLFFLFVAPSVSGGVMTAIMCGTIIISTILLLPIQDSYLRLDEEARDSEDRKDRKKSRIGSMLDRHHDEMQKEFARVMQEVDAGMNEASATPVR